jgi:hypothetical protein
MTPDDDELLTAREVAKRYAVLYITRHDVGLEDLPHVPMTPEEFTARLHELFRRYGGDDHDDRN